MTRKFIYLASGFLVFLCLAMGGVFWFFCRPVSTPSAYASSPQEMGSQKVAPTAVLPPPIPKKVRVRLAIGSLGFGGDESDQQLGDLVLAQLSGSPGLDLVERQSLDKVLGELGLNLSGLVRANEAVRAGKLLHADWFMLGTRAKIAGTNSVVVRIVDARTGIMRDAGVVAEGDSQTQLAGALAGFVREARQSAMAPKPRVYLAIGAFEDLSPNNRLADFATQLRGYLIAAYHGDNRVVLLEREYADTLLQELELDLAGLTEEGTASPPQPMQSAFWLVDGSYQSYRSGDQELEMTLDVQRMFGNSHHQLLYSALGEAADRRIKEAIDSVLNGDAGPVLPRRVSEEIAQVNKGRQIANLLSLVGVSYSWDFDDQQTAQQRRNAKEAIRAFETALILNPTNRHTKLMLAACLRKPVIGRVDDARKIYCEIIETPIQDQWSDTAKQALINTFQWASDPEKAEWFEAEGSQALNPSARDFYLAQASAARQQSTLESGGAEGRELAEQRLFAAMTNDILGHIGGFFATGEFLRSYGTDSAAAAKRLAELYPTFSARATNLAPYFLAATVAAQVDTNAPVVSEFMRLLDAYATQPGKIFHPYDFWWRLSTEVVPWCFQHQQYHMAEEIMETKIRAGELHLGEIREDDRICLAFAYKRSEQWQKALDIFQTYSNSPIKMCSYAPWDSSWSIVQCDEEAAYCRDKLGLPAVIDPRQFSMGKALFCLCSPSAFTADGDGLWIGIEGQLRHLDFDLHTNQVIQLPVSPGVGINAVCLDSGRIWIATADAGLIEFDKNTGKCTRFTVDDGLMMNTVSGLSISDNLLWIAYGCSCETLISGGLGNLNLTTKKFTSFVPTIADGGQTHRPGHASMNEPSSGPTLRSVDTIVAGPDGEVWFSNFFFPLRDFKSRENLWTEIPSIASVTGLAVGPGKIYVGRRGGPAFGLDVFDLKAKQWEVFPAIPKLPACAVTAIAPDGDDVWVGGIGYIARLDMSAKKLRHFAFIPIWKVDRIQIAGNYLWAEFGGHLYRAPLANLN